MSDVFYKTAELQPHKGRYWRDANPEDVAAFEQHVRDVCATCRAAPERLDNAGIHTVRVDEKTSTQALEPKAPTKPMRPGLIERREVEYQRHGTQVLIGNFAVATGEVIAPTAQQTRGEADFAAHIAQTIATDPEAGWVFVADNLTTRNSATLVLLIAGVCGIPADAPGTEGKSGVLKSVATRKAFLTDVGHRVRFVYVPEHTSWLNQIEIWFSVLSRRVIRRGVSRSTDDLRDRILTFIDYYNDTIAKPYKWTYAGWPSNV